jgi:DNA replication protein DnaC
MSDRDFSGLKSLLGDSAKPPPLLAQILATIDGPTDSESDVGHTTWTVAEERQCCRGSGYVRRDVPAGDANFGKLIECGCGLIAGRRASKLWSASMVPVEYAGLDLSTYPDQAVADEARAWYTGDRLPWLLLADGHGGGKTGLAIGIVKLALADDVGAVFRVTADLLDELRACYGTEDGSIERLMDALKGLELLVLDDVGAERMTGWAEEKLFQLLNHRHNHHRRTVLTTNLSPDGLMDHVGERIFWRIKAMSKRLRVPGNLRMERGQ